MQFSPSQIKSFFLGQELFSSPISNGSGTGRNIDKWYLNRRSLRHWLDQLRKSGRILVSRRYLSGPRIIRYSSCLVGNILHKLTCHYLTYEWMSNLFQHGRYSCHFNTPVGKLTWNSLREGTCMVWQCLHNIPIIHNIPAFIFIRNSSVRKYMQHSGRFR